MILRIKPHHFVDIIAALGAGRSQFEPHPYGHALHLVAESVRTAPDVIFELELGADDICEPCVHNIRGVCDDTIDISYRPEAPPMKYEWNLLIDQRWCKALGIHTGDRFSARELCSLLRRIDDSQIEEVYREIPGKMTAQKAKMIRAGIDLLLSREGPNCGII